MTSRAAAPSALMQVASETTHVGGSGAVFRSSPSNRCWRARCPTVNIPVADAGAVSATGDRGPPRADDGTYGWGRGATVSAYRERWRRSRRWCPSPKWCCMDAGAIAEAVSLDDQNSIGQISDLSSRYRYPASSYRSTASRSPHTCRQASWSVSARPAPQP